MTYGLKDGVFLWDLEEFTFLKIHINWISHTKSKTDLLLYNISI